MASTTMNRRRHASSDPLSVGRLISQLMARTGYDREQSASAMADAWREAAPAAFRDASRAGSVRRGVLDVFVSHYAHVQELGFHKQSILARLRELVPDAGISDIRCRLLADVDRTA
ncbi:MAG: DciA family protein [Planctomycetia bacterium]